MNNRLKALDGLRGIAVLLVLFSHASKFNFFIHPILNFNGMGKYGVYLFFILSAYLLDRQIASAIIKRKEGFWGNYFLRRFLRIYPLFVIALIVHLFLSFNGVSTVIKTWGDVFTHITLQKGLNIFWSIPVEFKYYFISPLIMLAGGYYLRWDPMHMAFRFTYRPARVIILAIVLIGVCIFINQNFELSRISTIKYAPVFLIGTILAICNIVYSDRFLWMNGLIEYAKRILEFKPLRYIGLISFSLYLFHYPILSIVKHMHLNYWINIYVFLGLSIGFSTITYFAIERPLSKIKINR
jgi:peptidoglycan/LPS O-acetylase OafA/YrhL